MTEEPQEEPPPQHPPDPDALSYRTPERILAGVLLLGALALGYICLDVLTDGALTRMITRRSADG